MDLSLYDLEQSLPSIPWREPILVSVTGDRTGYACRICIANRGLVARHFSPMTEEQARAHIALAHADAPDA